MYKLHTNTRTHTTHYCHSILLACFGCPLLAQVPYRVQQQQTVRQLEPGGEHMREKRDAANDPAPAAIRIEVLQMEWNRSQTHTRYIHYIHI